LAIISDFGVSKRVATANSETTGGGATFEWASHEQLQRETYGRSTSLGLVFAFMLLKTTETDRIEEKLRSSQGFGYLHGAKQQYELNRVVNMIGHRLDPTFDSSVIELLRGMLQIDARSRPKITSVQEKLHTFLLNTDEVQRNNVQNRENKPNIMIFPHDIREVYI
jgi:hypothetical protein